MPFLLLFVVMPILEIAVLLKVGGLIGLLPTLGIVVLTAVIGTRMLRQQGMATLERARSRFGSGEMPATEMIEGLLLLVGGVLLLTPGFVTDAFGFACLIPASRRWLAARLSARAVGVVVGGRGFGSIAGGGPLGSGPARPSARGEVFDEVIGGTSGRRPVGGTPVDRGADAVPGAGPGPGDAAAGGARSPGRDSGGDVIEGDYRRMD